MIPANLQISGTMTPSGQTKSGANFNQGPTKAYIDVFYTPPANIAGKRCLMHTKYMNHGPTILTGLTFGAANTILFSTNITSLYSNFYNKAPSQTQAQLVTAGLRYNLGMTSSTGSSFVQTTFFDMGPCLVDIPDGPFTLRITAFRPDGGAIGGYTTSSIGIYNMFGSIQFTPV
jgi:hypothetical protein